MGYPILQSQSAQPLVFFLVLTSDHLSPATGKSPAVTISKNGAAFASPIGAVTEIANGWYKVAGNATDSNTLGPLLLHVTEASSDNTDDCFPVVAYNPQDAVHLGLSCLPNTAITTNASLITSGSGTAQLSVTGGRATADVVYWNGAGVVGTNTAGVPVVDVIRWIGTLVAINVAGVPEVDVIRWVGGAVPAPNVTGRPLVDLSHILGTASAGAVGYVGVDWGHVNAPSTAVNLSATTINLVNTITTYTGNTVQTGDSYARLGAPAGASIAADLAEIEGETDTIPTAAAIATAVWTDTTAGDLGTASSPGKIIVTQLGGAFTTTSSSVFTSGALANAPTGGGGSGSGSFAVVVKVTSDGSTAIVGATVRISGNQTATNISDTSGNASLSLNAGAVTLSVTAPGYYYNANSQTINNSGLWVSSSSATLTITMTSNGTVTPSTDPTMTTAYMTVRDAIGTARAGVVFIFTCADPKQSVDAWNVGKTVTATSASNGLLQVSLPINSAWYMSVTLANGSQGRNQYFTTGSATTFALPQYLDSF